MTCELVVPIATVTNKHVFLEEALVAVFFTFGRERERSVNAKAENHLRAMQRAQSFYGRRTLLKTKIIRFYVAECWNIYIL